MLNCWNRGASVSCQLCALKHWFTARVYLFFWDKLFFSLCLADDDDTFLAHAFDSFRYTQYLQVDQIDKGMLENAFCSICYSGNHLFYKAKHILCLNQVCAITFDCSALATWYEHSWTAFWEPFLGILYLPTFYVTWKFMCQRRCRRPAPVHNPLLTDRLRLLILDIVLNVRRIRNNKIITMQKGK